MMEVSDFIANTQGYVTAIQFGADATGVRDSSAAFQALFDYLSSAGGVAKISGVYRVDFPISPADPNGDAALYLDVHKSPYKPTVLDFSGAIINYHGDPDTYLFRFYQSGNSASWRHLKFIGGYFDGAGTINPAGCILWDDMGGSATRGCQFNNWQRAAGDENAYAIHQRNYDTWSENCSHEDHHFTNCDTWFYTSVVSGNGATSSMARTRLENLFGGSAKAYAIINTAGGMYDSLIRNIKGNGQRIAVVLNTGSAVSKTHLQMVKVEQGEDEKTDSTGAITSSSNTLTVDTADFFEDWYVQGMPVTIAGAGSGGSDLVTYVTGYTSGTEVTVADAASTTVSGATVTVSSTVCYEDRSSLHSFSLSYMSNRDGDQIYNFSRSTSGDATPRSTYFGAIYAEERISAGRYSLYDTDFKIEKASAVLDGTDSSTWVVVNGVQANRCVLDLYVSSGNIYKGKYVLVHNGDTGTDDAVLTDSDKTSGYEQLELRANGLYLEVRSAADDTDWRGKTVDVVISGISN